MYTRWKEIRWNEIFEPLLEPLLTTTRGRQVGVGLVVLFALLLLVTIGQGLWQWRVILAGQAHSTAPVVAQENNALATKIATIPQWHLFGYAHSQTASLPVTSLRLNLMGVVKATPDSDSRAIIGMAGGPGKIYSVGDTLPAGPKVYAIVPDGVILENEGRLEKLPLARPPLQFQGLPKSMLGNPGEK